MGDLVEKLKERLVLSEIAQSLAPSAEHQRAARGWKCLCPFHAEKTPSFHYDDERGTWKCFGCGKQGDVLSLIQTSMRTDDFCAVLEKACEYAGLDYAEERGANPERLSAARRIGNILSTYVLIAESLWTAERYVQAKQRKGYLHEDVIERWSLGVAPTWEQCKKGGLSADELGSVGLLRPSSYDPNSGYMHFRDSILLPHMKGGRCVYVADRALKDDRAKKILNLPLPDERGWGGLAMPAHFNLEALWDARGRDKGVCLVEARLDAIACQERGHPAIAFLSSPTPAFAAAVKDAKVQLYYMPDGTKDVTAWKRAKAGGLLGWDCKSCRLPAGADPDDLSPAQLDDVKGCAVAVVDEFFLAAAEAAGPVKNDVLKEFADAARAWMGELPARAGEIRSRICEGLKLSEWEFEDWIHVENKHRKDAGERSSKSVAVDTDLHEGGEGDSERTEESECSDAQSVGIQGTCVSGDEPTGGEGCIEDSSQGEKAPRPAATSTTAAGVSRWPGQPTPLGRAPRGDDFRPTLANYKSQLRYVVDPKTVKGMIESGTDVKDLDEFKQLARSHGYGWLKDANDLTRFDELKAKYSAVQQPVSIAKNSDEIADEISKALGQWPQAWSRSTLFVDDLRKARLDEPPVRSVIDSTHFLALLHDYFRVKVNRGQDLDRANYVGVETIYTGILSSAQNWLAVERFPHEPALNGHYYVWKEEDGYAVEMATGEYLAKLMSFFDNVRDAASRAILAGAFLSPFWGGPYGKRPAIVFEAKKRGSGKSTCAFTAAKLCGEPFMINLDKHAEERIKERLLSPEGMVKRVCVADNVTGTLRSALLDEIVTTETISGKRLAVGEASRPNNLVLFITMNQARLSPDMTRRSFFCECTAPQKFVKERDEWDRGLLEFLERYTSHVIADCLMVLKQPLPEVDWGDLCDETFAPWARGVLARALAHPAILRAVMDHEALDSQEPISVLQVLEATKTRREERDNDREEARVFMAGLLEYVAMNKEYVIADNVVALPQPVPKKIFIRTTAPDNAVDDRGKPLPEVRNNMVTYWKRIFNDEKSAKTLVPILDEHIESGRLEGLRPKRGASARGYELDGEVMERWLERRRAERSTEREASDVSHPSEACETDDGSVTD